MNKYWRVNNTDIMEDSLYSLITVIKVELVFGEVLNQCLMLIMKDVKLMKTILEH
jgi:hypothetical protein